MAYSTTEQKTGIRLWFNGELVGGWNIDKQHLFILGTFAEADADRLHAFQRKLKEVRRIDRPKGKAYYWRLPERDFQKFRHAVEAATDEEVPRAFVQPWRR